MSAAALEEAVTGTSCEALLGGFHVDGVRVEPGGVWLALRTTRHDGRGTVGALRLFDAERLEDPRALPYTLGLLAALRAVIERGGTAVRWAVGWLDVRMPLDVLDAGVTAEQFCEQFLTYPWLGRLIDRPTKAPPYMRAPARAVVRDDALDLDALFAWIHSQAQRTYEDPRWDDAMIRALPAPVRVLEGLCLLDATVGGNGFEGFLAQARGAVVRDAYSALEAASADRLRALMAEGIALAAREGAEFTRERGKKWLEAFEEASVDGWPAIDGNAPDRSYALLATELRPCALRWAEAHRSALVR